MKRLTLFCLLSFALLFAAVAGDTEGVSASGGSKLKVTVTNLTKGQVFSPFIVASRTKGMVPLFELGSPASEELAALAEDGLTGPLQTLFEGDPHVKDVQIAGGPIGPGGSASVVVSAHGRFRHVTLAAMAVTTNDAFLALNGVHAPLFGARMYFSPAYDAGSEKNSEKCMYIPGPPCDNPESHDPLEAEGYVHIHPGIHGIGDLKPEEHDWRNPIAKITIRRIRH
jgi:hypothetical protein